LANNFIAVRKELATFLFFSLSDYFVENILHVTPCGFNGC